MSKTIKTGAGLLKLDRRAFFGLTLSAAGLGAAGAAPARAGHSVSAEPDLADATANAPGYSGQPKRRPHAAPEIDPLRAALDE